MRHSAPTRRPPRRLPVALAYLAPPILWMALLFVLSTDLGSSERTEATLSNLLLRLFPWLRDYLSLAALDAANFWLRKSAHLIAYVTQGTLNARAVRFLEGRVTRRGLVIAWAAATIYAALDEWHQSFSPTRTASPGDVALDALGAALAVLLYGRRGRSSVDGSRPVNGS